VAGAAPAGRSVRHIPFRAVVILAGGLLAGHLREEVAADAGLHGDAAVETPLGGGDLQDQSFLGGADRLEGVDEVIEKEIG
jgi:hypothetical protein